MYNKTLDVPGNQQYRGTKVASDVTRLSPRYGCRNEPAEEKSSRTGERVCRRTCPTLPGPRSSGYRITRKGWGTTSAQRPGHHGDDVRSRTTTASRAHLTVPRRKGARQFDLHVAKCCMKSKRLHDTASTTAMTPSGGEVVKYRDEGYSLPCQQRDFVSRDASWSW